MTPRKKRTRYRINALEIAKVKGMTVDPDDWELIWMILDSEPKYSDSRKTYTYAIADNSCRLIKFGKSKQPSTRLKQFQTGQGNKLILVCYCEHSGQLTEENIHKRLKLLKASGEWFHRSKEVMEVIHEMKTKAFVVQI